MESVKWVESLNINGWKDKLDVLMIVFISVVLKKTDTGNGYDFDGVSKIEFQDLIYGKMMNMEYDDEVKNLIIKMVKTINEYDDRESRQGIND